MHNLYQETLMDHYRNPRNKGVITNPDFASGMYNPSCGDAISIEGTLKNNTVTCLMFEGNGCVISQAGASLLTERARGCSVDDIALFDAAFMQSLMGVTCGPTRLKCVLLPLQALQAGLHKYEKTKS